MRCGASANGLQSNDKSEKVETGETAETTTSQTVGKQKFYTAIVYQNSYLNIYLTRFLATASCNRMPASTRRATPNPVPRSPEIAGKAGKT